jgi:hypothetical protein
VFCPYQTRQSGYGFAFPVCYASAKHTNRSLQMCYLQPWYFRQHCFWLRNSLHGNRSTAVGILPELLGFSIFPPSWSTTDSRAQWPFEDSVTVISKWQYLAGPRQVSPKGCQCRIEGAVSPTARMQESEYTWEDGRQENLRRHSSCSDGHIYNKGQFKFSISIDTWCALESIFPSCKLHRLWGISQRI